MKTSLKAILLLILLATDVALAEDSFVNRPTVRINGRKTVTVNQNRIYLTDVADVTSELVKDDESIIGLKKIEIDQSPDPGQEITIPATAVLEKLQKKGVVLSQVTYTLPRVITVNRASRTVSVLEVEEAVKESIKNLNREITVRNINYDGTKHVSPQIEHVSAEPFANGKSGQLSFTIHGATAGGEDVKFDITAQVDEWAQIPIARRQLTKGTMVNSDDVMMAKLNLASLPSDAFQKMDDVIGQAVNNEISYGEAFRKGKLSPPILVPAGSHVTMVYRSGALEATATGIAMEPGAFGQEIRVQNDSSKRVVTGKVIEAGTIGINP